jgi:predicted DNA-binding protein
MSEAGEFAMWLAVGGGVVAVMMVVYPLVQALAERIRIGSGARLPPEVEDRLAEMQARLERLESRSPVTGEVEAQYQRMAELEDRLDFAERLLTRADGGGRALPYPPGNRLDS